MVQIFEPSEKLVFYRTPCNLRLFLFGHLTDDSSGVQICSVSKEVAALQGQTKSVLRS